MVVDATHSLNDLVWEDEVYDKAVDDLVRLLQKCHVFKTTMFGGGLTPADLVHARVERKKSQRKKKTQKSQDRGCSVLTFF